MLINEFKKQLQNEKHFMIIHTWKLLLSVWHSSLEVYMKIKNKFTEAEYVLRNICPNVCGQ